jgi:hypothetical protein
MLKLNPGKRNNRPHAPEKRRASRLAKLALVDSSRQRGLRRAVKAEAVGTCSAVQGQGLVRNKQASEVPRAAAALGGDNHPGEADSAAAVGDQAVEAVAVDDREGRSWIGILR